MCGRIFIKPSASLSQLLNRYGLGEATLPEHNNLAPSEGVPVIRHNEDGYELSDMRWWFHPGWSKDEPNQKYTTFNARIETVTTSPTFRGAIKHQRGIVPAAAFVEWKTEGKTKQPYYIEAVDQPLAMAAIWDIWQGHLLSCAIITQPANESFAVVHSRMPLSLQGDQITRWLDPGENAKALIEDFAGQSLTLSMRPITTITNNARNKTPPEFI